MAVVTFWIDTIQTFVGVLWGAERGMGVPLLLSFPALVFLDLLCPGDSPQLPLWLLLGVLFRKLSCCTVFSDCI